MKERIHVIVKEPGRKPELREIDNTLEELQGYVGGYIETVTFASDLVIICNEDGRLRQMTYNCRIANIDFVGPILLCGIDGENFDDAPDYDLVCNVLGADFRGEGERT